MNYKSVKLYIPKPFPGLGQKEYVLSVLRTCRLVAATPLRSHPAGCAKLAPSSPSLYIQKI